MNTLRIILIIIGVVFIIGIYFYQTRTSSDNKKKQFLNLLLSKLKSLTANLVAITRQSIPRVKSLFDLSSEQQSQQEAPRNQETLTSEQLAEMSSMVANKASIKTEKQSDLNIENRMNDEVDTVSVEHGQPVNVAKGDELLITFTVLPKPGFSFSGNEILLACQAAGLQLGEYNIFHRYALVGDKVLMIPVCSLVNSFEPGYFDKNAMSDFTTEGLSLFMQLPGPVDGREAFKILMEVSEKLAVNLNATICDETRSVLTTQTISHLKEKVENYRFKLKMNSLKHR